jgi:hypothetical protein
MYVERRLLEPRESGGQVNQIELRRSAQDPERANERQFASRRFPSGIDLVE